jgi:hypothetical protein
MPEETTKVGAIGFEIDTENDPEEVKVGGFLS